MCSFQNVNHMNVKEKLKKISRLQEAKKISWRKKWQPTPVFLPGKFHAQRSLVGYCSWGHNRFGHNLMTKPRWMRAKCNKKWMWSESVSYSVMSTLCNLMDSSLPGSSVHGILQARTWEWVAIPFSKGSSCPGTGTGSPELYTDSLPSEPPGKPINSVKWKTSTVNNIIEMNNVLKIWLQMIGC